MNPIFTIVLTFILIIVLCWVGSNIKSLPLFPEVTKISAHKTLDGVRGFAAIAVVIHHSFFVYQYHINNKWHIYLGDSREVVNNEFLCNLIVNLGGVAVCVFFMVTGFLFFDKGLKSSGEINVKDFYIKRFKRIAPMYYFSIALIFLVSLCFGMRNVGGITGVVNNWFGWLAFGMIPYNGITDSFDYGRINAGVIWTLAIEWQFYIITPLIYVFCSTRKRALFLVIASFIVLYSYYFSGIFDAKKATIYLCFIFGMLSSYIKDYIKFLHSFTVLKTVSSILALASISFSLCYHDTVYEPLNIISVGVFFILVSSGCTIFGILTSRAFKFAGLISYSVYLMHGLILNVCINLLPNGCSHFYFSLVSVIFIILISALTYLIIERPFMFNRKAIRVSSIRKEV